jgi:hypothetical protein
MKHRRAVRRMSTHGPHRRETRTLSREIIVGRTIADRLSRATF